MAVQICRFCSNAWLAYYALRRYQVSRFCDVVLFANFKRDIGENSKFCSYLDTDHSTEFKLKLKQENDFVFI